MARIHLIEQDPDFAECLRNILESEGFEVSWTPSISGAVETIIRDKPSATIVDLHDGLSVKPEDIKNLCSASVGNPILVTADYTTPEIACKALGAGAEDYLLKPFSTREIIDRIHSLTGTGIVSGTACGIDNISDTIRKISTLDDMLKVTLDQLAGSLHLKDCLIALTDDSSFRIMASRGYAPDPTETVIELSAATIQRLLHGPDDPHILVTDLVNETIDALSINTHRPFPNFMPLIATNGSNGKSELVGFVMGHGAAVLDETDILEMELFLSQVSNEFVGLIKKNAINKQSSAFVSEGQFNIPTTPRDEAIETILKDTGRFLLHENDSFWVRLVLDEAINNAIIHGHGEPLTHPVTDVLVRYAVSSKRIKLTVEDKGEGFDHESVPDPTADENLLSINGRGIFLMRNIMDDVIFNERGNRVSMIKKIDGKPIGPHRPGRIEREFW